MQLIDPAEISKLGQLDVIATRIVEGFISGRHRSPYKGFSVEFAEHRSYAPGDDIRTIDWRVYARSDRYYIKEFEEETNLQALLVVDASGSMAYGQSTVTKLRYAQMVSACLTRLMLHQRDSVGLAVINKTVREYVPPRSRANHFGVLMDALGRVQPGGETSLAAILNDVARRIRRRGLIILCSDCFDEVESLIKALHSLHARGHELVLFHIMAPEELTFPFDRRSRFECLESPDSRIELDPAAVRRHYLEHVQTFVERLRQGCGEIRCDYAPMVTDRPLAESLAYYLARRKALMKTRG